MTRRDFNTDWAFSADQGRTWTPVTLPHDAQLTLARSPKAPGKSATGFFPGGAFQYRKRFTLTGEEAAGHVEIAFGGVYKNPVVRVNGKDVTEAGQHLPAYGYLPFRVSGDGLLREGENCIEVDCSNEQQPDTRWYSGAGIYRPVWMDLCGKTYLVPGSVRVRTLGIGNEAELEIQAKTVPEELAQQLRIRILSPAGEPVAERVGTGTVMVPAALLWSEASPNLYIAEFSGEDGEILARVRFGIRRIEWDKSGMYVNGESVLLRGGCIHADNGVIGARETLESERRRIRILKENGFNAIRCAHNPASEELLEACDELGMYVMDEMWDMWYRKKSRYDYAADFPAHYQRDIRRTVEKDFNHPSVLLYSIGNEVSEPAEKKGVDLAEEMVLLFHELDPSRPVTAGINLMILTRSAAGNGVYKEDGGLNDSGDEKLSGMNSTMFNMMASMVGTGMNRAANGRKADAITSPVLDLLDIAGYNYASGRYPKEGRLHPDRVILGSETFPQDIAKNWAMVKKYPYLVGDFMWTAWDYLGEAGIGAWSYSQDAKGFAKPYPWLLADAGAFDITGEPNGEALWARAVFGESGKPYLAVQPMNHPGEKLIRAVWRGTNAIPSWNFAGCEGNTCTVEVYSTAPFVALFVNGKRVGKKRTKEARALFRTRYVPGVLKAVSYNAAGQKIGEDVLVSGKGETRLLLTAEKTSIPAGGVVYLDLDLADPAADKSGHVLWDGKTPFVRQCSADRTVRIQADGAELLGFGSANPRTEERFDAGAYTTWYGHALAVLRLLDKEAVVTAEDGAHRARITLHASDSRTGGAS
ncbi:MAG: glycoside hydrolase family 2 protein [Lachnospiraceae bacterium]|jgi:hypothetical protein|nr:glycoside hydrolase family 2 protein [Lachnospiraceae bacterium]MCI1399056.1 glycoside hydrolase family 2 protein [Lachnospiraceae bacterium]MCI1424739.1 glycoside hydrolase family 2 protein [Lachnospiraceae bacterium]MCI1453671.1 glycoside hydrolase family 2 protein [Lachnospiraceae bacterium]